MSYQLGTAKVWSGTEWVDAVGGGLGWATVSDTPTGTYNDGTSDWEYWDFATTGTLTVTEEGLLDLLVIGGGGGAVSREQGSRVTQGSGGGVLYGIRTVPVGEHVVTIGGGGGQSNSNNSGVGEAGPGGDSSFGSIFLAAGGPGGWMFGSSAGGLGGGAYGTGGTGGTPRQRFAFASSTVRYEGIGFGSGKTVNITDGITLNYTGSNIEYSAGGTTPSVSGPGFGGGSGTGSYSTSPGSAGRIVVRRMV